MSQAAEILVELQRRGVIVAVEGDPLFEAEARPRRFVAGPNPRGEACHPRSLAE